LTSARETRSTRAQVALVAAAAAIGLVLLGAVIAVGLVRDRPFDDLTRDATTVADIGLLVGVLTRIEVLIWGGAAAIALAVGLFGRRRGAPEAPVLIAFGTVAAILTIDDALLVHEALVDEAGVPAGTDQVVYGALVVFLAWYVRNPCSPARPGCSSRFPVPGWVRPASST